jgi:hypothetical protein
MFLKLEKYFRFEQMNKFDDMFLKLEKYFRFEQMNKFDRINFEQMSK